MRLSLALSVLPLVLSVGAITITEPTKDSVIASSSSLDVKWTYVDTDATSLDIYLVNNAVYPPVSKKLASDISTSDGSHTVNVGSIAAGQDYQINIVSDVNNGILAQSGQFNVTSSASESTSSTSTSTSSATKSTKSSESTATSADAVSTTSTETTTSGTSTSTSTSTGTAVTSGSTTASVSGLKTSASSASSTAATSAPSTGAGFVVAARPAAALGVIGGALAFLL
ncbi:hypothetical protein N7520_001901 [Penicillium odoratum]|uniref:uncharacterized protein n=1 Tax=Penicillium odoratum TaxID=1167516 RepID=UPI002547A321|nr:uncharacterized protein N7520_001901 [Penicillium odoratum]KAJ5778655.1 hypothetical protein N7520_001901 [Penicillium odoratum]